MRRIEKGIILGVLGGYALVQTYFISNYGLSPPPDTSYKALAVLVGSISLGGAVGGAITHYFPLGRRLNNSH